VDEYDMKRLCEEGPKDILLEDHSWDEWDDTPVKKDLEELVVSPENDLEVEVEVKVEMVFQGHRIVATEKPEIKISEIVVPEEYKQVMSTLHLVLESAIEVPAQFFPYQRGLKLLGEDFMWMLEGQRVEEIEIPPEGAKTATMDRVNEIVSTVVAVREKIDGMEAASFALRCGEVWTTFLWDDINIRKYEGKYVAQYEKKGEVYYLLNGIAVPDLDVKEHPWHSISNFSFANVDEGIVVLVCREEVKIVRNPTYTVKIRAGKVNDDNLVVSPLVRDGCYDVDLTGKILKKRVDKVRPDGEAQRRAVLRSPNFEDMVALLKTTPDREIIGCPRTRRKMVNKIFKNAKLELDGGIFESQREDSSGKYHRYVMFRDCTTNHNKRIMRKVIFKNMYYGIWY